MPNAPRETSAKDPSVFRLSARFKDPFRQRIFQMMRRSIERVFLLDQLERTYQAARDAGGAEDFVANVLRVLRFTYEISDEDRARIPAEGPAVLVANHPFGGYEGLVLMELMRGIRPDAKLMMNYLLARMPELHPHGIFVDPFGSGDSPKANIRPMKEAIRWLRDGHMLMVFPSGEVSHLRLGEGVMDPRWSTTIGRILRRTGAPVVPLFIEGRNSALFQMMGLIHPRLRTAMLPREMYRKQGSTLRFRVGSTIPFAKLEKIEDDAELMDYLRLRTYLLMSRSAGAPGARRSPSGAVQMPVAEPLFRESLLQDLAMLPPDSLMAETKDCAVYYASAPQIPHLLHEIGRLREISFRAAGEGTGRTLDLDRFDHHYGHLMLWNKKNQELMGAYRIGRTDEILRTHGKRGLYTSTLFRYDRRLLKKMGPTLELGRSFIRPEYQRSYSALLLLWKGIAQIIVREPRYRGLFGPVSINNEYHSVSRQMMVQFLRANNFETRWAKLVRPRHPPARPGLRRWNPELFKRVVTDPEDMGELIDEIERERKGVPVLLKQYLKLGGKLLGFNVDPEFSDVLDGLIWVNLLELDEKILVRFFGREGADRFLAHHGRALTEPPAKTGI